ncbi:MAG: methyl-accepting chemotaxis protein [Methanobrevibacter sp.]|nr:methyl-accepting chemotaxis protein [Methanobrevibacter sp.]
MTCCKNKTITIYQGFGTRWDDQDLLTVTFKSDVDIDGFGAEFLIGDIKKTYENIQDGFGINLTAQETATLPLGPNTGTLVIIDTENNKRPFSTELPFMVKDWAEGDIKLDGFDITIDAQIQDNLLVINIESARAGDVEPTIDRKISEHNSSEQAHPYIRGLVSAEKEARIAADGVLQGNIDTVSASIKDGTLTIQKNGTTVQTFSANQSSNVTANLIIPTKTSDITNDSDFATNSGMSTAISNHNTSESAHSYIQGLISSEETRAKGVEGTLTSLTTDTKTNLVSAINEVDFHAGTNTSSIGTLSNLTTEVKTNLVSAINEVDSHADTNANNIGTLTSLTTDAKTNLVSAINEVDSHTDTNTSNIGTISSLTTDVKTTLVGAINEVDSHTDTNTNNIGTLTSLTTTDKTNLVSAINEVNGAISSEVIRAEGVEGTLTNLTTDSKTNLVSAINEVDSHTDTNTSNIGTLTSLTTDVQSNLVAAINEVDSHADTNASSIGTLTSLTTDAKTNLVSAINEIDSHVDTNASDISDIKDLIPSEATSTNQLADKEFVNSSISTNTANFIGTFDSISSLEGYSGTVTNNDYAFVINGVVTDNGNDWATFADLVAYDKALLTNFDYAWVVNGSNFDLYRFDIVEQDWDLRVSDTQKSAVTLNTAYNRYKATVSGNVVTWAYEYTLNNSSFTAEQWASINSGATTALINQITTNKNAIGPLASLTTTSKTDLVGAINELDTDKVEANTAITGATKCKITYDSKGLVTGGANLEASDIPSLTLSKISDVSATASEVNVLDGITASTAELNILDGVTANATEINVLDGITASTSELNVLDGITATTTELNYVDGVTSSIQTQLDGKVPTARTINNKSLTSDITLGASDVGALPDSTTIGDATLTIQKNGTTIDTFTANATSNKTVNVTVPTDTSDLTNSAGYITGITSTDVTTALGYIPYNSTNPAGYVTSSALVGYATETWVGNQGFATQTWVGQQGFLTSSALSGYATETWVGQQGYITGINSTDVTNALGYTPANTDLSNLTSTGKNISNWSSNVSNCITDIPQDIKLELNNGTLTLKAGSKVYVPNGVGVFDEVTVASDISRTESLSYDATYLIFYTPNGTIGIELLSNCFSGSSAPSGQTYMNWYDTTNNVVKRTENGGSTWTDGYSLPIAICTQKSGSGWTSIDQVFNGFGYIGSTVFALPGMSGLVADGKNSDGTYKSIPVTISSVQTVTIASNISANNARFLITDSGSLSARIGTYDKINNYVLGSDGSRLSCFIIADSCSVTSGVINTFNRKQVFHALDWNDSYDISGLGMPSDKRINLTLGASGTRYTAPANGYFYVNKQSGGTNLYMVLTNETSGFNVGTVYAANAQFRTHIAVRKGDVVKIDYSMTGTTNGFVFFYAEGEVNV